MELFRLFGSILIEDQDAINSLKNVDNKGKETKSGLSSIADHGAKIGAAIAGAGVVAGGALLAMTNKITETTGAIKDSADRAGFTAEEYQKWAFAAEQSGVSAEGLEKIMIKQQKSFADAKTGSESMSEAYKALGIDISSIGSSSDAFDSVMKKLGNMKDETKRNALANDIFGKSYAQLTPLLNEGGEGMESLKQKAVDLGGVMSNEAVANGEQLGDTLDQITLATGGLFNSIATSLLPTVQNAANWVVSNMPAIEKVVGGVLDKASSGIGFIVDNSNILIPILAGVLAGFVAMKAISVVSGLMAAYTTFTTTATGAQLSLSAAMMANPIGLVIAAIAALVAAGVLLYQNWDTVKQKATELSGWISNKWDGIKRNASEAWGNVKNSVSTAIGAASDTVKEKLNNIKNAFEQNGGGIKGIAAAAMEGVKGYFTAGFDFINTLTGGKLDGIKNIFTQKFDLVKEVVGNAIDKIKSFFNFNWEFPKLKMPHFSVSGSMNPLKWIEDGVPKLSVSWYKNGGIFDKPTIFNTQYGLKGVGDASSPEVVSPLSDLNSMISEEINKAIAPLYINTSNNEAPVIENTIYFGDDKVWKSVKRAMQKEDRRYNVQTVY